MIAIAPTTTQSTSPILTNDGELDPARPPRTPDHLHTWLRDVADVDIARTPMLPGSTAPFEYLVHTFYEGRVVEPGPAAHRPHAFNPIDAVLWANRGGGKTFLGALATTLDLVYKPGIQVRILGGSLEQSRRMHAHLRALFDRPLLAGFVDGRMTDKRLRLKNGSCVEVLAQSETAVRGTRVQKLRCDEVELFDRDIWNAAQLTTRSMRLPGPWGQWVRGSVEALSTMHRPYGLMWEIVGEADGGAAALGDPGEQLSTNASMQRPRRRLFRWGVVDVLSACGPEHRCDGCALWDECGGRAKLGAPDTARPELRHAPRRGPLRLSLTTEPSRGHIPVADALAMKARVDLETWRSEMLCLRPRRSDSVFPEFDPSVHIIDGHISPAALTSPAARAHGTLLCGMDFGFRAPTVVLWAIAGPDGTLRVIDERILAESRLDEHIAAITLGHAEPGAHGWPAPAWIGVDPAGRSRHEQTGRSNVEQLAAAGLHVKSRSLGLQDGLALIRARLAPADASAPRLFIHRRCTGLIESLQRYHYPEDRPESIDPVKDGPDHAADALRYLIVNLDRPHRTVAGSYVG